MHHEQRALQSLLHKLEASCGFVGAQQLYQATRRLRQDLSNIEAQHHLIATIQKIQWIGLPEESSKHSFSRLLMPETETQKTQDIPGVTFTQTTRLT